MLHLTRLRMVGFKSFVETADVLIDPGLTGIVGPNGCGKSNVVEALRWVMGETSARQLRGGEMDDVIFGGTSTRPARNLAEVTLLLDNRDHTAPPMFNAAEELEITRRIRRGDGSVYRVNGKEVRARDVQLLFADAASGARSAAMVSQGRVAALIQARPAQRRALLEEAAGIAGLHTRRQEAQTRLSAAQANLDRLDDVVNALRTQLSSLGRQARQAHRYRDLSDRLQIAEATVLRLRWLAAIGGLDTARRAYDEAERQAAAAIADSAAAARRQNDLSEALPPLRVAEGEVLARLQRLTLAREHLEAEDRAIAQTRRENTTRLTQSEVDAARETDRLNDALRALSALEDERLALEAEQDAAGDRLPQAQVVLDQANRRLMDMETLLSETDRALADFQARRDAQVRSLRDAESRVSRLEARLADAERQQDALRRSAPPPEVLDALRQEENVQNKALEDARRLLETLEHDLGEARSRDTAAAGALREAQAAASRLRAEADGLNALLKPTAALPGERDPLLDHVRAAEGYELPLAAVLGEDLQAGQSADTAAFWRDLTADAGPLPPLPDGARPLADHIEAPAVLHRALATVGVVETAAAARAMHTRLAPGQQLVDREGGVWRWDGFVRTAGMRDAARIAASRLETRNRLAVVAEGLAAAEAAAAAAADTAREVARTLDDLKSRERTAREALRQAERDLSRAQDRLATAERETAASVSRLEGLEQSLVQLRQDVAEARADRDRLTDSLTALGEDTPLLDRRATAVDRVAAARTDQRAAQTDCDRLQQAAEARSRRLALIDQERGSWEQRRDQALRHAEEFENRRAEAQAALAALDGRPEALAEQKAALQADIAALEQDRKQIADGVAKAETDLRAASQMLKDAQKLETKARETLIRAEAAVDQGKQACQAVAAQISEKRACTPEALAAAAGLAADADLPPLDTAEQTLTRLNRERDALGPVNLCAEEESRDLTNQVDTLERERTDLVEAIARLHQAINELNKEGRARLLDSFEKVDRHFQQLFQRLFGGGQAHLSLVDAQDPLEAGLEIMASPPGKRLQSLSLLSGGEQALTALALLFAVFLTNPAPICVLDEVDAPLDDANVDRLCTMLRQLTDTTRTRFLVVTHHRMTMARMDRLFGVTMAERGVSSVVSVDLQKAEELAEPATGKTA